LGRGCDLETSPSGQRWVIEQLGSFTLIEPILSARTTLQILNKGASYQVLETWALKTQM
jgi:hypothetical protein